MGFAVADYSSCVVQSSLPFLVSKARKRASLVAPMNTNPPAVTMGPANAPDRPVFRFSGGRKSVTPSGTCQAISPVFAFTANNRSHGGLIHGRLPRDLPSASLYGAEKLKKPGRIT